jgi:hypothetical protein
MQLFSTFKTINSKTRSKTPMMPWDDPAASWVAPKTCKPVAPCRTRFDTKRQAFWLQDHPRPPMFAIPTLVAVTCHAVRLNGWMKERNNRIVLAEK